MGLDIKTDWTADSEWLILSQLRVAFVRIEKLVTKGGDSSETQRKGNVRSWKPLPSNG
jgi:hypothetical protein